VLAAVVRWPVGLSCRPVIVPSCGRAVVACVPGRAYQPRCRALPSGGGHIV